MADFVLKSSIRLYLSYNIKKLKVQFNLVLG